MEKRVKRNTGSVRTKKMVLLLMVMSFLFTGLLGCAGKNVEEAKPLEDGVLKVGMNLKIPSMCYLAEKVSRPEGFEVEVAEKLAEKAGLKLEIMDTSEKNLLKSLDGELYDCVISAMGIADWNESHYSHTQAYADIASVKEQTGLYTEYTRIAVFTKKNNPMVQVLDEKLGELKKDGTLKQISEKYFGKDISIQE